MKKQYKKLTASLYNVAFENAFRKSIASGLKNNKDVRAFLRIAETLELIELCKAEYIETF